MSDAPDTRVRVGPGEARAKPIGGPDTAFEYVEGERGFEILWEPRESGDFLPVLLDRWTYPVGTKTTPEEQERILDGLWSVAKDAGVEAIFEHRADVEIARRWNQPDRFHLREHPPTVEYMELGRTLTLSITRDLKPPFQATVVLPADAKWTTGAPVTAEERARIVERLREKKMRVS